MNLETLYKSYRTDKDCKELLLQSHWFASFADFDPKTGETLPMSLNKALDRISSRQPTPYVKDRLWLLMKHSEEAARRLMKSLSEEPRREPAYLPIREVRELDTASFIALSRRPGRNIREKLADKPYMQAVRHYQSIDVPENRLLKTYLMQLADALELRKEHLHDKSSEDFLQSIYRWLNEEEIGGIARWENLTPNNTLLSHRDYRRVWNSWRLLQTIEDDLDRDMKYLAQRRDVRAKWEGLAKKYASGNIVFADMPILVDYNKFRIDPWDKSLPSFQTRGISHEVDFFETNEPVCLDLTQIQPIFATPTQSGKLSDSFFWQRWSRGDEQINLELFDSDAVYVHGDATTVTCCDMFFFKGDAPEVLNQASRSFSLRLREHFHNGRMIWLTPDSLNDFDLELVRRNINAGFSKADPVPCSVAAVFEHIDYSKITHDGFKVAVVERINGKAYLTEMVARFDKELKESLPKTRGFIWEKGTSELISRDVEVEPVEGEVYILGKDGTWTKRCNPYGVAHKTDDDTIMAYEGFDCAIWLSGRPVKGGIRLYQLQSQVVDIPLWRNHIPELMTKVMMDGFYQPFYFVGKDVTVQPVRGKAIRINVPQEFTLPKGKKAYRLPLLQGSNEEALEYEAKLVSKDFPYIEDVKCRLDMTYTYGADDPYHLVFIPLDKRYRPINVIWQLKEDVVIEDAPVPGYPAALTWAELRNQRNPKTGRVSDLLEWSERSTLKLLDMLEKLVVKPISATMETEWKTNPKGTKFAFAESNGEDYYVNEFSFLRDVEIQRIGEGDRIFFYATREGERTRVWYAAPASNTNAYRFVFGKEIKRYIRSSLYVPYISIWAHGKSINEAECPNSYRKAMANSIKKIKAFAENSSVPDVIQIELVFLLCCMGADMPREMGPTICEQTKTRSLRAKALGYSLGDIGQQWQREALDVALMRCDNWTVQALSAAAWRNKGFISGLTRGEVAAIVAGLSNVIEQEASRIIGLDHVKDEKAEIGQIVKHLELLLGLLRTRESGDEVLHMLLQPGQDPTVLFADIVDRLIENALKRKYSYSSRLELDVSTRSADDRTPDLLYALRMYLTGDDAANAIRVTGIVEDEE